MFSVKLKNIAMLGFLVVGIMAATHSLAMKESQITRSEGANPAGDRVISYQEVRSDGSIMSVSHYVSGPYTGYSGGSTKGMIVSGGRPQAMIELSMSKEGAKKYFEYLERRYNDQHGIATIEPQLTGAEAEKELIDAAAVNNIKRISELLNQGVNVNSHTAYGITPLLAASSKGNTEAVNLLLQKNANINAKNNDGQTALMLAAMKGHKEIVIKLLEAGANPSATQEGQKMLSTIKNRDIFDIIIEARRLYRVYGLHNGKEKVMEYLMEVKNNPTKFQSSRYSANL